VLKKLVNTEILPSLSIERRISEPTARRWLHKLGYSKRPHQKGLYFDGHERPDVVKNRNKFLSRFEAYNRYVDLLGSALGLISFQADCSLGW
jgi:hypothetical protein